MYLFVLKKTVAERSPEGHDKLEEMFEVFVFAAALKMDVSNSTQVNLKGRMNGTK